MGFLIRWLVLLLLRLRYRITVTGLDDIAARGRSGILFLPNHPSLLDPVMVLATLHARFRPRSLADKDRISLPVVSWFARIFGVIPLPDPVVYGAASKQEVARAMEQCSDVLRGGGNLLLYPAGHLSRSHLEELGGNSAVEFLLARSPQCRVVLVRTSGIWGSMFSWAPGRPPEFFGGLRRGCRLVLANLVCFVPKRCVTIELVEATDLPRTAARAAQNRYIEDFYNAVPQPNLYVPHTVWERGGIRELPDPQWSRATGDPEAVSAAVREQIVAKIAEMSGATPTAGTQSFSRDLGIDSLSRMELIAWVEQEFGHPCVSHAAIETVNDLLLVAAGQSSSLTTDLNEVARSWFSARRVPLELPPGRTIAQVVLQQASRDPDRVVFADQTSGVRTYRDLITAILVLRPKLAALEGEYLGIMLPASVGAAVLYLATVFAGKVPVMVNWTTGTRNLAHGLDLLGVRSVVTASALLTKLGEQGIDFGPTHEKMLPLETLTRDVSMLTKLTAALSARLSWHSLRTARVHDTAVVLFTSGSESLPKAVPLSHDNLLANIRDIITAVHFDSDDKFMGFLPPFHSFGLTGTVLLPVCTGVACVFFPNPTDGVALARMIAAYRAKVVIGTPTFLGSIVRSATDAQLATLRLAVTGAEKCPIALYDIIATRWPKAVVLEGYGITECSPVVSANREAAPRRGTIGTMMPSLRHVIVDLERGEPVERGHEGMLMVRGPSVFTGYLHHNGPSPFAEYAGDRWYRTGDLVREDEAGSLVFVGRLKRFVKLGGEMVSLPAIEEALAPLCDPDTGNVTLAVAATATEGNPELCLFAALPITREQANQAIRTAGLSALHYVRRVIRVEAIPCLGTGKTDYRTLQGMLS